MGELWNTFVILIPLFFFLTLIFGAGFVVGRVLSCRISKRE